jgi:predicted nucleic acid-binding protein
VVSDLAPGRHVGDTFDRWVLLNEHRFHLSVISIAEIVAGVAKLRRTQAFSQANAIETWLGQVIELLDERVLPFDLPLARQTGELSDFATSKGVHPGFPDVAIAATALRHGLTVVTRNVRHFAPLAVPYLDALEIR